MSVLQQFNSDGGFVTAGNVNAGNVIAAVIGNSSTYLYGDGSNITGIGNGGGSSNIIYNGSSNVSVPTANGNVYINVNDGAGNVSQWHFDASGSLTLPTSNSNSSITTTAGSNNSITIHPDGNGIVYVRGATPELLTIYNDLPNVQSVVVLRSYGNALGNAGGGTFIGSYLRPNGAIQAGDRLAALGGRGSPNGVDYAQYPAGRIQIMADDTWSANSTPTRISFLNTNVNTDQLTENMRISPNGNVEIYNGNVISRGAYISGSNVSGTDALYAGFAGYTPLGSNVIAQFAGNVNSYAQINFQNINAGNAATTEFVLTANNGNDTAYFGDFGIAGSTYVPSANDLGTAVYPNDTYVYAQGSGSGSSGNLVIGSNEANGVVRIIANGSNTENIVATFNSSGILPVSTNISGSAGESSILFGTRRAINGVYSGAQYAYSKSLAAGGTPTVAYTATNNNVLSVKVTFAVQSTGSGFQWEQFDVVAVQNQDTPGQVNIVVSNRVKAAASIGDTQVTATLNGSSQIEISLNLDAAQNSGGTSSFDAVEFGLMVD
jgi:hypothetical protein